MAYNRVFDFATNSVSFRKNEVPAKYRQIEGVRGSKRVRVKSLLMPLFPVSRREEKQGRKIAESSGREIEERHGRERHREETWGTFSTTSRPACSPSLYRLYRYNK